MSPARVSVHPLFSLLLFGLTTKAVVIHYPPAFSNINNFSFALNGTGSPGIFGSSTTPDKQYGEYNWCNMPHVRTREYKQPSKKFTLKYVEVIQRHHKRTPYSSNTFFKEDVNWNCDGYGPLYGLKASRGPGSDVPYIQWEASASPLNPWTNTVGPGFIGSTCQFPQITEQGLEDSITHGRDLRAVYAERLDLDARFDPSTSQIRVTNNQITSQVASGLLRGLFPDSSDIEVLIQPSSLDSLEPRYTCEQANQLKTAITTGSQEWNNHLTSAAGLYAELDVVSGIAKEDKSGWHSSFDHYYDNLSAKQCHGKSLPCSVNDTSLCITQDMADTVYRLGNWEYSWQFRDAPDSALYSALRYGAWVLELKGRLQAKISDQIRPQHSARWINLASLGFPPNFWDGLAGDGIRGAESFPGDIVFELYSSTVFNPQLSSGSGSGDDSNSWFVRVLWGGQPMKTSTPLGVLDMISVDDFLAYIDSMLGAGSDLLAACNS